MAPLPLWFSRGWLPAPGRGVGCSRCGLHRPPPVRQSVEHCVRLDPRCTDHRPRMSDRTDHRPRMSDRTDHRPRMSDRTDHRPRMSDRTAHRPLIANVRPHRPPVAIVRPHRPSATNVRPHQSKSRVSFAILQVCELWLPSTRVFPDSECFGLTRFRLN